MHIRTAMRVGLAVTWLATAALAGCSSTIEGEATCPAGCIGGSEPDFPTARPTVTPPSPPSGPPTTTRTMPTPVPVPPSNGEVLPPSSTGYVYIETKSGKTRCQISADTVGCESDFTDPPSINGETATGVEVSASGSSRWVVGNLGAMPTTSIDYSTYQAVGWTIEADSSGTRFTNDDTGHGMFISTDGVNFF